MIGASSHGGLPTTSVFKGRKPPQPPGFNNRLNANWKLLLQIAQHAGGGWPEQARRSAIYLSRAPYEPSVGVQLPAALRAMFAKNREVACRVCGAPFPGRENGFVLKYVLLRKAARRNPRAGVCSRRARPKNSH